ncbi:MAG TPA: M48 family metalloprotease [Lautropia sp.]|nr:M48 family metalloprotease [Lautropia sp.]
MADPRQPAGLHDDPALPAAAEWVPWTATEREAFLDAIARHRRNAWRVTLPCAAASSVLALVLAVLLAPLLYSLLGLGFDAVNLVVPTPDLLGHLGRLLDKILNSLDSPNPAPLEAWYRLLLLAPAPGLVVVLGVILVLRRALQQSPLFHPTKVPGRPAMGTDLAEQRFSNTVAEMATAATIPVPQVAFVAGGANAAAFGRDDQHAVVIAGSDLLARLDRQQMQGVAGHLVASIADGDMKIGMRTALTLGLFALPAALSAGWSDRARFAATARLLRALLLPTQANLDLILKELNDPFRPPDATDTPAAPQTPPDGKLTWREWALMPIMGPVVLSGFLSGLVSTMMLAPAVALAWRHRKFMADANAVRLTRDADALAGALAAIGSADARTPIAAWAGHLCVVDPGSKQGSALLGGSYVSVFPPLQRRLKALVRLGANPQVVAGDTAARRPILVTLLIAVLLGLVAVLLCVVIVLLVWVSLALSGMFTLLPAALLHALLR